MAKRGTSGRKGRPLANGVTASNGESAHSGGRQAPEGSAKDVAALRLIELAEKTLKIRVRLTDDGPRVLIPTRDGAPPEEQHLRDGRLAALLSYHFAKEAKAFPPAGSVEAAIRYLEGKALDDRRTMARPLGAELTRLRPVILELVRRDGDLWGPAEKIRKLLNALAMEGDAFRGVKVPATADAVGKTLAALAGPMLMDDSVLIEKEKRGDERGWRLRDLSDLSGGAFADASSDTSPARSADTPPATSADTSGTGQDPTATTPGSREEIVDPDLPAILEHAQAEGRDS